MNATSKLAMLAILCWPIGAEARRREDFVVMDAQIQWDACLASPRREIALACHRIVPGHQLVLATRHRLGTLWGDRGSFQKMTIVLPQDSKPGDSFEIGSDGIKGFFSDGSSAFPGKADCFGFARSGNVVIESLGARRVVVRVNLVFDQESSVASRECSERSVDLQLSGEVKSIENLNSWEGVLKPGVSLWREANP